MAPPAADVHSRRRRPCRRRDPGVCLVSLPPARRFAGLQSTRYSQHHCRLDMNPLAMLRIAPPRVFQAVDPASSEAVGPSDSGDKSERGGRHCFCSARSLPSGSTVALRLDRCPPARPLPSGTPAPGRTSTSTRQRCHGACRTSRTRTAPSAFRLPPSQPRDITLP
jgi:hypothetical protein